MRLTPEWALRRPDFVPGTWIALADGQGWSLPHPRALIVPTIGPAGLVADVQWSCSGHPEPGFNAALWTRLARRAGRGLDLGMAGTLLRRNYRLDPRQCRWLLFDGFDLDSPAGRAALARAWREIIPLALEDLGRSLRRALAGLPPQRPDGTPSATAVAAN